MDKESLEMQLGWTKKQIELLDKMESKLQEMKKVVQYASENNLSRKESRKLNRQLEVLKAEYDLLERKRHFNFH